MSPKEHVFGSRERITLSYDKHLAVFRGCTSFHPANFQNPSRSVKVLEHPVERSNHVYLLPGLAQNRSPSFDLKHLGAVSAIERDNVRHHANIGPEQTLHTPPAWDWGLPPIDAEVYFDPVQMEHTGHSRVLLILAARCPQPRNTARIVRFRRVFNGLPAERKHWRWQAYAWVPLSPDCSS